VAVLAIVIAACGSNGSTTNTTPTAPTTPTVQNPTITGFSVSPTFGVSGLTLINMSASATDPANNPLTYTWSYGNSTATGSTNSATLTGDGTVSVQLTVGNGKGGSTTQSQNVTIGTLTGTWNLNVGPCGGTANPAIMTLTQTGNQVAGSIYFPNQWCNVSARSGGSLKPPATIDAQGNVQLLRVTASSSIVGQFLETQVKGQMDSTGRTIVGVIDQSGFHNNPMTMTKQ
jgi:hypothetical protein